MDPSFVGILTGAGLHILAKDCEINFPQRVCKVPKCRVYRGFYIGNCNNVFGQFLSTWTLRALARHSDKEERMERQVLSKPLIWGGGGVLHRGLYIYTFSEYLEYMHYMKAL